MIIAQQITDLSTGLIGNGILGAVLGWLLLKYIPDKDRLILRLIESRDKAITAAHSEAAAERQKMMADFQASLSDISVRQSEEVKHLSIALEGLTVAVNAWDREA